MMEITQTKPMKRKRRGNWLIIYRWLDMRVCINLKEDNIITQQMLQKNNSNKNCRYISLKADMSI